MTISEAPPVSLAEKLNAAEEAVRREPAVAHHRWILFQWLCIGRQWVRAMQQLQAWAKLDPMQTRFAQACRDLVRAERWREKTLSGLTPPGYVLDATPTWMADLYAALELNARGDIEACDAMRERALDQAPLVSGRSQSGTGFEWIGDSDSRLGPVCELIVAGAYRWLSFEDIRSWRIIAPVAPVDLVWARCDVRLVDGTSLHGFMPARYPDEGDDAGREREDLLMGRHTCWRETGRTGVLASGRKTWTTDAGEFDLFELGECVFDHGSFPGGGAEPASPENAS
ncbi:type VI secretion system accessory protein TagJ [Paraburkholderia adhaesiva]|uniref:type VI secretion system accessory protein TagJ n=1 Tax=Paraburkholderia adhaesiva TaxID=2883244 RepID=UPI001F26E572|nr:type VI secretion system accessory protein TagJ [Paraburkholderia adhaesiva]